MKCAVLTGSSASNLESVINAWLAANCNSGSSITIKYVAASKGTVGASAIKAIIFYHEDWTRADI